MILTAIVFLTSAFTGNTCAAIDNRTNTAVWHGPNTPLTRAHYDDAGDRLIYGPAPAPHDNAAWLALHNAEAALTSTPPAPKVRVECVDPATIM